MSFWLNDLREIYVPFDTPSCARSNAVEGVTVDAEVAITEAG